MLAAVVGGNLQGVEAAYLAKKAGWDVLVVDRRPAVPAKGLCDRFVRLDVAAEKNLGRVFKNVDLVIPALENDAALACLDQWSQNAAIPLAFDLQAYCLSSSKLKSNRLFHRIGVPAPLPWPACGFPVVAKPTTGSGSHGVTIFHESERLSAHTNGSDDKWVLQEFIHGPSYSIEIIGSPAQYVPLQVTDLGMDADYDCKRVLAPTDLAEPLISEFERISLSIAESLQLNGLMDVEVILQGNTLKVLEIDARLPSQTPTAVYWSTGLNMVRMLGDLFLGGGENHRNGMHPPKGVVYEHIRKTPDRLEIAGEHMMSGADALRLQSDFFGADEAITNYAPGRQEWVATLIVIEQDRDGAWEKHTGVIDDMKRHFHVDVYRDASPEPSAYGRGG